MCVSVRACVCVFVYVCTNMCGCVRIYVRRSVQYLQLLIHSK